MKPRVATYKLIFPNSSGERNDASLLFVRKTNSIELNGLIQCSYGQSGNHDLDGVQLIVHVDMAGVQTSSGPFIQTVFYPRFVTVQHGQMYKIEHYCDKP